MKAATLAPLFSLSGVVAPAAVPQKPLALGGISRNQASASLRDTHFRFTLPSRHEIAQCAGAELRRENGTRSFSRMPAPYRLFCDGSLISWMALNTPAMLTSDAERRVRTEGRRVDPVL
ncbi:hypothetical protein V8D89_000992 [Ganoderma adspersum]